MLPLGLILVDGVDMILGLVALLVGIALVVWRRPVGRAFAWNQAKLGGPSSPTTAATLAGLLGVVWIVGGVAMIVLSLS